MRFGGNLWETGLPQLAQLDYRSSPCLSNYSPEYVCVCVQAFVSLEMCCCKGVKGRSGIKASVGVAKEEQGAYISRTRAKDKAQYK